MPHRRASAGSTDGGGIATDDHLEPTTTSRNIREPAAISAISMIISHRSGRVAKGEETAAALIESVVSAV